MAIINSMGVGRARKSMGNVTYRTVRGRTIGSQKRAGGQGSATTRGIGGNTRKPLFAMINVFMAEHASDIQVSFNKSRYGSQRNYFFTLNYSALSKALATLAQNAASSGELPSITEIESAIASYATANPRTIYRVRLDGFAPVYLSGEWSEDDNPISGGATDGLGVGNAVTNAGEFTYTAPTAMSLKFHAGAKIVRDAGQVVITGGAIASGMTAADIKYLTAGGSQLSVTVTNVESSAGRIAFSSPALTESQNVLGVLIGTTYVRLSSAYVKTGSGEETDPLG